MKIHNDTKYVNEIHELVVPFCACRYYIVDSKLNSYQGVTDAVSKHANDDVDSQRIL